MDFDFVFRVLAGLVVGLLLVVAALLVADGVDAGVVEFIDLFGVVEGFGGLDLAGAHGVVVLTLEWRDDGGDGVGRNLGHVRLS